MIVAEAGFPWWIVIGLGVGLYITKAKEIEQRQLKEKAERIAFLRKRQFGKIMGEEDNMILQSTNVADVFIDTKPSGADIFIDDMLMVDDMCRVVKTPIIMTDVPKGLRKFTFKLLGYYNETVIVDIIERSSNTVFSILFPKILT